MWTKNILTLEGPSVRCSNGRSEWGTGELKTLVDVEVFDAKGVAFLL